MMVYLENDNRAAGDGIMEVEQGYNKITAQQKMEVVTDRTVRKENEMQKEALVRYQYVQSPMRVRKDSGNRNFLKGTG